MDAAGRHLPPDLLERPWIYRCPVGEPTTTPKSAPSTGLSPKRGLTAGRSAARDAKALVEEHHRNSSEKHARTEHVEWMASAEGELEANARQRDQIEGFQEVRHRISKIRALRACRESDHEFWSVASGSAFPSPPTRQSIGHIEPRGSPPQTMWPIPFTPPKRAWGCGWRSLSVEADRVAVREVRRRRAAHRVTEPGLVVPGFAAGDRDEAQRLGGHGEVDAEADGA